jgi:Cd2+/Zn2+-exporting ATPase
LTIQLKDVEEILGHGLKANINGKELLVGNFKLMEKFSINYDIDSTTIIYTLIAIAYDRQYVGYLTIADSIKEDAQLTIDKLKALGVKTTMLSGDKNTVVQFVAQKLGIKNAFGDLLPEDKVNKVKEIIAQNETVAFVGDGVNDAPVVALSTVGIAMGGLGSDATIETADVVIQDDKPSKIPMAINIGKQTKKIVWQNITMAFVVKGIVLLLGAGGLATMWEAVFADVGVALLAILNAVRIQKMNFNN